MIKYLRLHGATDAARLTKASAARIQRFLSRYRKPGFARQTSLQTDPNKILEDAFETGLITPSDSQVSDYDLSASFNVDTVRAKDVTSNGIPWNSNFSIPNSDWNGILGFSGTWNLGTAFWASRSSSTQEGEKKAYFQ